MTKVPESAEIKLGDKTFKVKAFTLDEIQGLLEDFAGVDLPMAAGGFEASRKVITSALAGQISAEELGKLHVTLDQIMLAVSAIAEVTGMAKVGEALAQTRQQSQQTG